LLIVKRFDFGGAENHVCELANSLAADGHQVWLLSGPGFQSCRLHRSICHHEVRFSDLKLAFHLYFLVKLIRKQQIEIVHAHQRFPIYLGSLAAKWCRIPIVGTVHGSTLTDLKSRFVKNNLAKVITIRTSALASLSERQELDGKIVMIPNGINVPPRPVVSKGKCGGFKLFYISRLDQHHAQLLHFFLAGVWPQMVDKHPGSTLCIVGDGTGLGQIKQFWQSKRFNPYRETVHFEGYCCDVPAYYPGADLVMGVGRVAIECLVYGVPLLSVKYNHLGPIVVRSNFNEMKFANFVDLEAPPPNSTDMLNRLEDFLAHKDFYELEAKALQQIALEEFNQDSIVEKIVEIYQEVI
jgi:glycosyltransferase involved in cell wall biosynthesis